MGFTERKIGSLPFLAISGGLVIASVYFVWSEQAASSLSAPFKASAAETCAAIKRVEEIYRMADALIYESRLVEAKRAIDSLEGKVVTVPDRNSFWELADFLSTIQSSRLYYEHMEAVLSDKKLKGDYVKMERTVRDRRCFPQHFRT